MNDRRFANHTPGPATRRAIAQSQHPRRVEPILDGLVFASFFGLGEKLAKGVSEEVVSEARRQEAARLAIAN